MAHLRPRASSRYRNVAETEKGVSDAVRRAALHAFAVLNERDPAKLTERVLADTEKLLQASLVRVLFGGFGSTTVSQGGQGRVVPSLALEMERELLWRALAEDKSLISTHPQLDPALARLAQQCAKEQIAVHLLLARTHGETQAAFAVHWIGHSRPWYEFRVGFYYYWDNVGHAIGEIKRLQRLERELEDARQEALVDGLTGLPNGAALDQRLGEHGETTPLSVLALDFDGLRDANNQFKSYEGGGDVLIRAFGSALPALIHEEEFGARLYTAGDEFAILLPGVGRAAARARARELEAALETIDVPESHRAVYHGAAVASATRRKGETPGQTLGRAIEAMHARKHERKQGTDSPGDSAG